MEHRHCRQLPPPGRSEHPPRRIEELEAGTARFSMRLDVFFTITGFHAGSFPWAGT